MSPIKDPDRLLQDVDINRLRAVVFRDVVSRVFVCVKLERICHERFAASDGGNCSRYYGRQNGLKCNTSQQATYQTDIRAYLNENIIREAIF